MDVFVTVMLTERNLSNRPELNFEPTISFCIALLKKPGTVLMH